MVCFHDQLLPLPTGTHYKFPLADILEMIEHCQTVVSHVLSHPLLSPPNKVWLVLAHAVVLIVKMPIVFCFVVVIGLVVLVGTSTV